MAKINIFWHRRDLRIHDNAGLHYALTDGLPVLPIFIFDSNILDELEDRNDPRVTFIHDQVTKLHAHYHTYGSTLQVYYGTPEEVFKSILENYEVNGVFTNRDYEPYATARDSALENSLKTKGVGFFTFKDQVIFETGEVLTKEGEPYKVFTPYKNKWLEKFRQLGVTKYDCEADLEALLTIEGREIPPLSQMKFERTKLNLPTAEVSDALISNYASKRDFPAEHGTSRIGVHLRFGTVSIRDLVRRAQQLSETWLSELIWREFYMMILAHYPRVTDQAFKPQYDRIPWLNDEAQFDQWCRGMTGYPLVDAGMRELNATGYMHNRVRMVVASFLTKHLLIDWRWGERYFAEKLLDFELSSNNGGWQWAAGTGTDAQPYFRVFNPQSQQEKFDPELNYIRRWVPEYGSPDYPDPMVPHKEARLRSIETYKRALSQN